MSVAASKIAERFEEVLNWAAGLDCSKQDFVEALDDALASIEAMRNATQSEIDREQSDE